MEGRKKQVTILFLLVLVFLGMELYQFLPEKDYRHFYPLDKSQDESLQWYAKDIAFRVFILSFTSWAWFKEWRQGNQSAKLVFIFPLFWALELAVYFLYHSHRGTINLIIYIPITIYGICIIFEKQTRNAAEWLYSQWQKLSNGNNR